MNLSVESTSQESPAIIRASAIAAWSELKACLDRRSKELSEEVRNYPTPIARCDEQLTKLIEQRTRAFDRLNRLNEVGPLPRGRAAGSRLAALDEFLRSPHAVTDDARELAIQSRLRAALSALRNNS